MTRVAIIGPGAIGLAVAAALQEAGRCDFVLCGRRRPPLLEVRTPRGVVALSPSAVWTEPAEAEPADWVLVTTKAYAVEGAAAWFPALRRADPPVAILQNGVDHRDRFADVLPAERIVPVIVDLPCERESRGGVWQRADGTLTVADDAAGRAFGELWAGSTLTVRRTDDFVTEAWRKLCLNSVGALSVLTDRPVGVMRDPAVAGLARGLLHECMAVGRAEGAVLPDEWADEVVARCQAAPPDAVNSMLADRRAGRPMEVEARNGVVVRLGARHGIPTPLHGVAVALLAAMGA